MACHYLFLKNTREFFDLMKNRNSDLILKMVKCVLSAAKRGKDKIDIFDISFKDTSSMIFTIDKSQYKEMLGNCMDDLISIEEFNNMLENGDIFEYGLSELENQLQNISSNQFIIQLIRKNYDMIRDNDDVYNRICNKMDECLKDYGRK